MQIGKLQICMFFKYANTHILHSTCYINFNGDLRRHIKVDLTYKNPVLIQMCMLFVNFGSKLKSWRPGNSLKSFLEVICFNLAEHQLVRSHMDPYGDHMGSRLRK